LIEVKKDRGYPRSFFLTNYQYLLI